MCIMRVLRIHRRWPGRGRTTTSSSRSGVGYPVFRPGIYLNPRYTVVRHYNNMSTRAVMHTDGGPCNYTSVPVKGCYRTRANDLYTTLGGKVYNTIIILYTTFAVIDVTFGKISRHEPQNRKIELTIIKPLSSH